MANPYQEMYEDSDDIYDRETVEEMLDEEDSISPEEEAFMRGYNQADKRKKKKSKKQL